MSSMALGRVRHVRGSVDFRDALVLYDGIPIASANDGTLDLAEISTAAIETIRVLKSAPSVIYGLMALPGSSTSYRANQ